MADMQLICPEPGVWVTPDPEDTFSTANPSYWYCVTDCGSPPCSPIPIESIEVAEGGGMPPLSIEDAEELMSYAVLVLIAAWAAKQIINMLIKPQHRR